MVLEIAAFNASSALMAAKAGANRIELCENMHEGGVTPSYGAVKIVRQYTSVPLYPMIRPRGGDFLYTDDEVAMMKQDILAFKALGCEGVVLGLLNEDGSVDKERTRQLVQLSGNMEVTFHRAFDRAADPLQAMEDIIECGCKRILTSGQMPSAMEGITLIKELVAKADGRIIILPGCGVTGKNIAALAEQTGAIEFHSAARATKPSLMKYQNPHLPETRESVSIDTADIEKMKKELGGY